MALKEEAYFVAFMTILSQVGQGIFLPLFISTFTTTTCNDDIETGIYFVLFIMSFSFTIIFGLASIYDFMTGKLTWKMMNSHVSTLISMGVLDAANGLLVVFSSSLGRTNGALQAILAQLVTPFTFLFSKYVASKHVSNAQIPSVILVLVGIIVGSMPNFLDLGTSSAWFYPILFALAAIPGSLMNVIEHLVFDVSPDFSRNWMLFMESFFQLITIVTFFWMDLVPDFGTSTSLSEFAANFRFGFECFFDPYNKGGRCYYSFPIGLGFCLSYCGSYYFSSKLIKSIDVNFSAVVAAIAPPLLIVLWFSITPMTEWGCGSEYTHLQIILGAVSIPLIATGAYLYRVNKSDEEIISDYFDELTRLNEGLTERIQA